MKKQGERKEDRVLKLFGICNPSIMLTLKLK
ncbi:hypothetical protein Echvi_1689 [Echinicola vietnamensis DSM 17526]|uniref:Uncharacterized protein n=1 Tax=Echinicola vietnamensis (strain DSM 17526 / LMG 23754 / KMM 6221) TaxID=926556 RepID=L0FVN1_ECHVK|nr:hypothetical protein Echvi_1689 [Echinicola vietnamensis DSM 17526]